MVIILIFLSIIPAFILTRLLFSRWATSGKPAWIFYYLAAVIALVANPFITIFGVILAAEIFYLPDREYIGWFAGPILAVGMVGGVLGAIAGIMLKCKNQ